MRTRFWSIVPLLAATASALAQTEPRYLQDILKQESLPRDVATFQLREYILRRTGKLPTASSATQWTADSKRVREQLLSNVVFHGWPKDWVDSPPKFQEVEVVPANGYRMRKLRYEIVPGFQSVAILYEPLSVTGKIPAVLNVNGHVGAPGKAVEYKQKQSVTLARNGILTLSLEWFSCGELSHESNAHWYGAHLDLVGVHELGLFYLAMRRGLDYLYDHSLTDRKRLGMTGLSGGGWQTIILSSLDERVNVSVPVAGFSSIVPRVEAKEHGDIGDIEQSAADLFQGRDYPWLAALRAPRPTLLAYNAEDDCCFRAPMVKGAIFDAVRPFFALYDKDNAFQWHENRDPGTHNYGLDNRMAAYAFFSRYFGVPAMSEDPSTASEVRSYEDLVVGLPADNLTILDLARQLSCGLSHSPSPDASTRDDERKRLREVVRYVPLQLASVWTTGITKRLGVESKSHLFTMSDGLADDAIWLHAVGAADKANATIILDDKGKSATSQPVADRVNRGEQVLALELPFHGPAWDANTTALLLQMITTTGGRPLGIDVAHLIEVATWFRRQGAPEVRVETNGLRTQVIALIASALEPKLFSEVVVRSGIRSLDTILEKPVKYQDAPELFCPDLYKTTDISRLAELAAPARVRSNFASAAHN